MNENLALIAFAVVVVLVIAYAVTRKKNPGKGGSRGSGSYDSNDR